MSDGNAPCETVSVDAVVIRYFSPGYLGLHLRTDVILRWEADASQIVVNVKGRAAAPTGSTFTNINRRTLLSSFLIFAESTAATAIPQSSVSLGMLHASCTYIALQA